MPAARRRRAVCSSTSSLLVFIGATPPRSCNTSIRSSPTSAAAADIAPRCDARSTRSGARSASRWPTITTSLPPSASRTPVAPCMSSSSAIPTSLSKTSSAHRAASARYGGERRRGAVWRRRRARAGARCALVACRHAHLSSIVSSPPIEALVLDSRRRREQSGCAARFLLSLALVRARAHRGHSAVCRALLDAAGHLDMRVLNDRAIGALDVDMLLMALFVDVYRVQLASTDAMIDWALSDATAPPPPTLAVSLARVGTASSSQARSLCASGSQCCGSSVSTALSLTLSGRPTCCRCAVSARTSPLCARRCLPTP
jgi:hypothetical protein